MRPVVVVLALVLTGCGDEPDWPDDIPDMPACGRDRGCHVIDEWTDETGQTRRTFVAVETVDRLPGRACGQATRIVEGVWSVAMLPGVSFELWRHEVMHTRGWTHDDMPATVASCAA